MMYHDEPHHDSSECPHPRDQERYGDTFNNFNFEKFEREQPNAVRRCLQPPRQSERTFENRSYSVHNTRFRTSQHSNPHFTTGGTYYGPNVNIDNIFEPGNRRF